MTDAHNFYGRRVKIIGDHPHAGKYGVYLEDRRTILGVRPVVRLDDGGECFVMKPTDWRPTATDVCERCEGRMMHSRTKGYRCPRCD